MSLNKSFLSPLKLVVLLALSFNSTSLLAVEAVAWQARHGLSASQYQTTFDDLVSQGYRLTQVSGYTVNGQDRYAAIWDKSSGPAWLARHGLTSAQYQTEFDNLASQGYCLLPHKGLVVRGLEHACCF